MDNLKFIETMSVADFKTKMGVDRIDVKQNPNTGKCFFVYGCETGAVSERFLKGDITAYSGGYPFSISGDIRSVPS